jgi:hypothetical protein
MMFDPNEYEAEATESITEEKVFVLKDGQSVEVEVPDDEDTQA